MVIWLDLLTSLLIRRSMEVNPSRRHPHPPPSSPPSPSSTRCDRQPASLRIELLIISYPKLVSPLTSEPSFWLEILNSSTFDRIETTHRI